MTGAVAGIRWRYQLQRVADVLEQRAEQIRHVDHPTRVRPDGSCPTCEAKDRYESHIREVVDKAPPLSPATRERLRALLGMDLPKQAEIASRPRRYRGRP